MEPRQEENPELLPETSRMRLLSHESAALVTDILSDPFARQMLTKMSERLRAVDEALSKLDAENIARHSYLQNLSIHRDWAV